MDVECFQETANETTASCRCIKGGAEWLVVTLRENRGATLVTALLAMLMLSTLGMMLVGVVSEDMAIAANHADATACLYLADAGVHLAVAQLNADGSWPGIGGRGQAIGRGRVWVAVSDSTDGGVPLSTGQKRVTVTARQNGAERQVEVVLQ